MKFYDHATNMTKPAQAQAVARARRDSIADGTAYRVEFENSKGETFYWDGCRYDALQLAKDLAFNKFMTPPRLFNSKGELVDIENARY